MCFGASHPGVFCGLRQAQRAGRIEENAQPRPLQRSSRGGPFRRSETIECGRICLPKRPSQAEQMDWLSGSATEAHGVMASLVEVWSLLRQVQSLRFNASSGATTGWDGIGTGAVIVTEPAVGVVIFDETGAWQPSAPDRPAMRFHNVFRWSKADAALRLEHLRFGADSPVLLFDMALDLDGQWREVSPHQCRDDCYAASLRIEERQLLVAWTVQGPRKRESIQYTYW